MKLVDKRVKQALKTVRDSPKGKDSKSKQLQISLWSLSDNSPSRTPFQEGEAAGNSVHQGWERRKGILQVAGLEEDEIIDVFRGFFWEVYSEEEAEEEINVFLDAVSHRHVDYDKPHTYPDFITALPLLIGAAIIVHNVCPVHIINRAHLSHIVHHGPDVLIHMNDLYFLRELSVGWKYLLPNKTAHSLITNAWDDLKDRLRWKCHFAVESIMSEQHPTPYDPDFAIPKSRRKFDLEINPLLEWAFREGDRYVDTVVQRSILDEQDKSAKISPTIKALQHWLTSNGLVVVPTNKNLGLCVVTGTWLHTETKKFLTARNSGYRMLPWPQFHQIMDLKVHTLRSCIARLDSVLDVQDKRQLIPFLQQHFPAVVTPQGNAVPIETQIEGITLPQFYGIPKVHKNPIKLRPIAPCHSAIQNPMAKLISKILKPFVEITPSICGGTKELAIEFSTLRLPRFEQFWLVSGDIVAYYPNIPVVRAIEDVVYETHRPDSRHIRARSLLTLIGDELFTDMLTAALTNLVVSFEGLPYLQTDGVAMGVAASPDIANLYAAPADRSLAIQREVKFLKRYIDDIFSIIKAPTAEEALNIAKRNWQLAGCTVHWATPGKTCVFLDMFIYLDERNQIQWKPFRKAHNHLERVPWDSSHPIDVKRGTFIGELSRLAVLSSRFDHYSDAASDLAALYQHRGYPDVLVRKWLREHLLPRWENRFADKTVASHEEHLTTIALKTHFNDAWNDFSINELVRHISKPLALVQDTWRQGWFGSIERPIEAWQLKLPFFDCPVPFPREDFPALDRAVSSRDCWMETAEGVVYGKVTFFDLQQLLCDDAKWVVSRRRTKRFGDLALAW